MKLLPNIMRTEMQWKAFTLHMPEALYLLLPSYPCHICRQDIWRMYQCHRVEFWRLTRPWESGQRLSQPTFYMRISSTMSWWRPTGRKSAPCTCSQRKITSGNTEAIRDNTHRIHVLYAMTIWWKILTAPPYSPRSNSYIKHPYVNYF